MSNYKLEIKNLSKIFGQRIIFQNINYSIHSNFVLGISGSNGSGKSTLVKIIAGVLSPTKGHVNHFVNGEKIDYEKLFNFIGFVSPYLILYEEFSAEENLKIISKIRGIKYEAEYIKELLAKMNLYSRRKDIVKTYSSGMKQRLKFIFALMHRPNLLILDEPTSNLDNEGKESVYSIIKDYSLKNIVIIASNEEQDLAHCNEILFLEKYKSQ
ncbi:MAG: ABC transporter ATP-binding protein [Ignavibacterium sp.]|nr:ABC transporter ATP-binding protein [Ignavibacterium sp.]MDW8375510.1 ABC transporter ATP-binding protein [Ignavibacteriales bacterium]